jgi:asparagine synthase (glutamine-hydrolysing)
MIGPYIALTWIRTDVDATRRVGGLRKALVDKDAWVVMVERPGQLVFARLTRPISVRKLRGGRGMLIGDLFDADGVSAASELFEGSAASRPTRSLALELIELYWGRYVVVFTRADGRPEAVFRDPSGALDCACWMQGGLHIASNDPPDALLTPISRDLSLDWNVLAEHLADPSLISTRSAFRGLETVTPGALRSFGPRKGEHQIWRPSAIAAGRLQNQDAAEQRLAHTIDRVVVALSKRRRILAEVSGGLDSSIVASALKMAKANVTAWITFVSDDRAGDETIYAQALGRALGFQSIEVRKSLEPVTPSTIAATQNGVEVSLNALDRQYDRHILELADTFEADALFTGFGGDAVFFQMADPAIIEDLVSRLGRRMLFTPALSALARWTRRSAYELAWRALWSRRCNVAYPTGGLEWRTHRPSPRPHPWCADIDALPPAKRLQIISLTHMLSGYGRSLRGIRLDLIHPHLTQPVLEFALRTPVDLLVKGWRDRGLTREAFRDRLPKAIVERRSKGDLGVLHAENFVAGLPELRPFLLDGRLVQAGLIDRARLDVALDERALAQHGGHPDILHAAATEAWVRHWAARLERLRSQSGAGSAFPRGEDGA